MLKNNHCNSVAAKRWCTSMYVKCVTHYRSSVFGDTALNVMQISTIPRASKNYFGNDMKVAAGGNFGGRVDTEGIQNSLQERMLIPSLPLPLPNIIRTIKSRKMRWTRQIACAWERKHA